MFFIPRGDIWNYTAYWEKVQIFEPKENVLPNCVTRFKELKELYEIISQFQNFSCNFTINMI